jgi:hypothetical protein
MSTPVRGADGPLGYAPRWARSGSGRADTAQEGRGRGATPELPRDLRSPRIVMPPRETGPVSGAVVSREAVPHREFASRRDVLSAPEIARQEPVLELDDEPFGQEAFGGLRRRYRAQGVAFASCFCTRSDARAAALPGQNPDLRGGGAAHRRHGFGRGGSAWFPVDYSSAWDATAGCKQRRAGFLSSRSSCYLPGS